MSRATGVRRAEIDGGTRPATTTEDRLHIAEPEKGAACCAGPTRPGVGVSASPGISTSPHVSELTGVAPFRQDSRRASSAGGRQRRPRTRGPRPARHRARVAGLHPLHKELFRELWSHERARRGRTCSSIADSGGHPLPAQAVARLRLDAAHRARGFRAEDVHTRAASLPRQAAATRNHPEIRVGSPNRKAPSRPARFRSLSTRSGQATNAPLSPIHPVSVRSAVARPGGSGLDHAADRLGQVHLRRNATTGGNTWATRQDRRREGRGRSHTIALRLEASVPGPCPTAPALRRRNGDSGSSSRRSHSTSSTRTSTLNITVSQSAGPPEPINQTGGLSPFRGYRRRLSRCNMATRSRTRPPAHRCGRRTVYLA